MAGWVKATWEANDYDQLKNSISDVLGTRSHGQQMVGWRGARPEITLAPAALANVLADQEIALFRHDYLKPEI
jgi:hypothetical protein